MTDPKKITAAVKIHISLERHRKKIQELTDARARIVSTMNFEERMEYNKRIV